MNNRTGRSAVIWVAALFAAGLGLGIGAAPRYIEELRVGGGFGDTVDGGSDLERDGDFFTDGSIGVTGGVAGGPAGSLTLSADTSLTLQVDADDNGAEIFAFLNGAGTEVANIDETGAVQIDGDLTVSGNAIKDSGDSASITFDGSQNTTFAGTVTATSQNVWGTTSTIDALSYVDLETYESSWTAQGQNAGESFRLALFQLDLTGVAAFASGNVSGQIAFDRWSADQSGTIEFWVAFDDDPQVTWGYNLVGTFLADPSLELRAYDTDKFELVLIPGSQARRGAFRARTGSPTLTTWNLQDRPQLTGSLQSPDWKGDSLSFDGSGNATFTDDVTVGGNDIKDNGGTWLSSDGSQNTTFATGTLTLGGILMDNDDMVFKCDADGNGSNKFSFTDGAATEIARITETGALQVDGGITSDSGSIILNNVSTSTITAYASLTIAADDEGNGGETINFDLDGSLVAQLDDNGNLSMDGGVNPDGNSTFGDASTDVTTNVGRMIFRSVTDAGPMTATAGTQGEIVFNSSDSKFYGCTATGSPATWVALH